VGGCVRALRLLSPPHSSFPDSLRLRSADKFHPDDLDYALGVYLGAMKSGEDFAIEYRIKDAHGVFRWHMCEGRAHRDSEGEITFWVANINKVDRLVKVRPCCP